jgi:hypothetical protein
MKKFYILLAIVTLLMSGCKKDSDEGSSNSTWTINGKSYSAAKTLYSVADYALLATDNVDFTKATNAILLSFEEKPTSSGAYTVLEWTKYGPSEGEIYIEIVADGKSYYETAGQSGDYASISVLSGGKLKVTFNNVTFIDDNNNKVKATGTIVEQ